MGWRPGKDESGAWYWIAKTNFDNCIKVGAPAVRPLIAALTDSYFFVRAEAAKALGKTGDASAVKPLSTALKDSDANVRQAAIEGLLRIGGACIVEPLIAALTNSDCNVRVAAVDALGNIGDTRAIEPLIDTYTDDNYCVRRSVVEALGKIGNARAVEPLIAALKDSDVRRNVVEALGKIGIPAVEPLIAALRNRNISDDVAEALGMIGDTRAVEPLIAALMDKDEYACKAAARALEMIGDTRAMEPLIAAVKREVSESNGRLNGRIDAIISALEGLGWQPGKDEIGACYWIIKGEWRKCVEIGAPADRVLITYLYRRSHAADGVASKITRMGTSAVSRPVLSAAESVMQEIERENEKWQAHCDGGRCMDQNCD